MRTVEEFRVELEFGRHFVHQVDNAGEFPAGLEEQFVIPAVAGGPDNAQGHFHDRIKLAEQPQVQVDPEALSSQGHFLLQVLPVALEFRNGEAAVALIDEGRGGAGQQQAVEVFDLIVLADFTGHSNSLKKI